MTNTRFIAHWEASTTKAVRTLARQMGDTQMETLAARLWRTYLGNAEMDRAEISAVVGFYNTHLA